MCRRPLARPACVISETLNIMYERLLMVEYASRLFICDVLRAIVEPMSIVIRAVAITRYCAHVPRRRNAPNEKYVSLIMAKAPALTTATA